MKIPEFNNSTDLFGALTTSKKPNTIELLMIQEFQYWKQISQDLQKENDLLKRICADHYIKFGEELDKLRNPESEKSEEDSANGYTNLGEPNNTTEPFKRSAVQESEN